MKVLAFSDIHCDADACVTLVDAAKDADLVIGAGDFSQHHLGLEQTMELLEPLASKAIYVPGNNETVAALRDATSATVLHGDAKVVDGVEVFGIGAAIPPLPPLPWESYDLSEIEAEELVSRCDTADIFISHSPPKGIADTHVEAGSMGSQSVLKAVIRMKPRFVFCGHIHDCWGQSGKIGDSLVYNLGPTVNWYEI